MTWTDGELNEAVTAGILSAEQLERLRQWQRSRSTVRPRFDLIHVLYYSGALLVLGAMGWYMNKAIESLPGWGIFALSLAYAAAFVMAGRRLWERVPVAGGLFYTIAVGMTPLAVYGLERAVHWWPGTGIHPYEDFHPLISGQWVAMEFATILVALVALRRVAFPFLVAPLSLALFYLSMDGAEWWWGQPLVWREEAWFSTAFGLLMLVAGWLVDRRTRADFAFWLYFFGTLAFWGGLTSLPSHGEAGRFVYFLINLALIALSLLLDRKVFLVFGALGCSWYIGHLAFRLFPHSLAFPLVLSLVGVGLIALGVQFHRHQEAIEAAFLGALPEPVRRALPRFRNQAAAPERGASEAI